MNKYISILSAICDILGVPIENYSTPQPESETIDIEYEEIIDEAN